jgi:hypothetical protein
MRPLTLLACASLAVLAFLSARRPARAATPETVNVSPGDTEKTWQTPLMPGSTGEDPTACMEDISCDTVRIVLAAGDWTGKRIVVAIHWLSPPATGICTCSRALLNGQLVGKSDGLRPRRPRVTAGRAERVLGRAAHAGGARDQRRSARPEIVQGVARVEASRRRIAQGHIMILNGA